MIGAVKDMMADREKLVEMGRAAGRRAWVFDIARTEAALISGLHQVCG